MSERKTIQERLDAVRDWNRRVDRMAEERRAKQQAILAEINQDEVLQAQIVERGNARKARIEEVSEMFRLEEAEHEKIKRELASIERAIQGLPPVEIARA